MTSQNSGLDALFASAVAEGALSQDALNAINIQDVGADINAALGVSVDDVTASEVVLVTQLIDDSGSIRFSGNSDAVRFGHNLATSSLVHSKQNDGVLAMCRFLNGTVLYPYKQINQVPQMDASNYDPRGGTPLYDETYTTLLAVIAKAQEFTDSGIACRTVTLITTDGADAHSHKQRPSDVKRIVTDMLKAENHIIAFMGIWDGQVDANKKPIPGTGTDFHQVAREMGIPDQWILTPDNTDSEIRKAFMVFSQSAQRASQSAKTFSQAAMGGFGG